ncbi:MAG TPA: substrate-binding domain-containing protein [Solirubrobacteraceae bacterium]|jgi:ABC-type sugar transport system substrate-binding protein
MALAMTAGIAACGSSNKGASASNKGSSSSGSLAPGQVANVKKETIGVVDLKRDAPIQDRMDEALEAGGKALGWDVKVTDCNGEPEKVTAAMNAFANEHVNAMIVESIGVESAPRAVQELEEAKAPIIAIGGSVPANSAYAAQYTENETELATILAEKIVEDHPEGAKIGDITLTIAPATVARNEALKEVVAVSGGKAEIVTSAQFELENIVSSTEKIVTDMLTAHPDINSIWGVADDTVQPGIAAILKKHSNAQLYSFYSDPSSLEALRKKGNPLAAVADVNLQEGAIVALDQLVGYFQKNTPIDPNALPALPYKIIDRENVPPEGEETYPLKETLQPYEEKWEKEYPAK